MNSARNIRKSAMARVRSLLTAPPAASGLSSPYTLYDVKDLRALWKGTLTQVRPSCFVIEGRIKPAESGFPLVMVTTAIDFQPFELGNVNGGQATIDLNVVGRMSGERDDLADLFAKNFGRTLPLFNYSGGSTGSFIENAVIADRIRTFEEDIDTDMIRAEGAYDYWDVVRLQADFLSA